VAGDPLAVRIVVRNGHEYSWLLVVHPAIGLIAATPIR